jgi:hypothetical protein
MNRMKRASNAIIFALCLFACAAGARADVKVSAPALSNTLKAKAKSDGEDILTQLVEQTAQAIVNAVARQ